MRKRLMAAGIALCLVMGFAMTGIAEENESGLLEIGQAQDFSDKGYLLPIDFSAGSEPDEDGYGEEWTYEDSTISVKIVNGNNGRCNYWYADIQLTDASQLRTTGGSPDGASFDTEIDGIALSGRSDAVVAINGDFWTSPEKKGKGYVVRQGILYRNALDPAGVQGSRLMDVLLIDEDGDFIALHQPGTDSIPATVNGKRILNAFSFGPILVENGEVVTDFRGSEKWINMEPNEGRQRNAICQVGPLHYIVLCCAGPYRGNYAMTLGEFAEVAGSLGVQIAYNLDGGDSTLLYFDEDRVNNFGSTSQRKLRDIIYFASAEQ